MDGWIKRIIIIKIIAPHHPQFRGRRYYCGPKGFGLHIISPGREDRFGCHCCRDHDATAECKNGTEDRTRRQCMDCGPRDGHNDLWTEEEEMAKKQVLCLFTIQFKFFNTAIHHPQMNSPSLLPPLSVLLQASRRCYGQSAVDSGGER